MKCIYIFWFGNLKGRGRLGQPDVNEIMLLANSLIGDFSIDCYVATNEMMVVIEELEEI